MISVTTYKLKLLGQSCLALIFLSLPVSTFACIADVLKNQSFSVVGTATDRNGQLLYTEHLTQTPDETGGKLSVIYRGKDSEIVARKEASYNCNPTTPSFTLEDKVNGKTEGVRWNEDKLVSFQDETVTEMAHPGNPAAVDSGFDNVIKLNWEKLMDNKSVKYDYLFARKNKFLKLKFSKSRPPKAIRDKADDDIVFFKVGANNMLFRMLSDPIYVGYRIQSKSLAYYYGPSNLPMIEHDKPLLISYQTL